MITATEEAQPALLNLNGKELNAMWVDEKQALFVPQNPLHWKAHKLQVLLGRLDKQAEKNPAQFNSTAYVAVLDKYLQCCESINNGATSVLGSSEMDSERAGSEETATVGEGTPARLDIGISADNPISG